MFRTKPTHSHTHNTLLIRNNNTTTMGIPLIIHSLKWQHSLEFARSAPERPNTFWCPTVTEFLARRDRFGMSFCVAAGILPKMMSGAEPLRTGLGMLRLN